MVLRVPRSTLLFLSFLSTWQDASSTEHDVAWSTGTITNRVVRRGAVWRGVEWCVMWCGAVWQSAVRFKCDAVWCSIAWCGVV